MWHQIDLQEYYSEKVELQAHINASSSVMWPAFHLSHYIHNDLEEQPSV
jgi:hypothetical protein